MPAAKRHRTERALPARRAGKAPRHLRRDAALVKKDETFRTDRVNALPVGTALGGNLGPILLARPESLFLRGKPRRCSARQSTGELTRTPVRAARRSAYSARVAAFSSRTSARSTASAAV